MINNSKNVNPVYGTQNLSTFITVYKNVVPLDGRFTFSAKESIDENELDEEYNRLLKNMMIYDLLSTQTSQFPSRRRHIWLGRQNRIGYSWFEWMDETQTVQHNLKLCRRCLNCAYRSQRLVRKKHCIYFYFFLKSSKFCRDKLI